MKEIIYEIFKINILNYFYLIIYNTIQIKTVKRVKLTSIIL